LHNNKQTAACRVQIKNKNKWYSGLQKARCPLYGALGWLGDIIITPTAVIDKYRWTWWRSPSPCQIRR